MCKDFTLTLTLPDGLAREAEVEVRRRQRDKLFRMAERLAAQNAPLLDDEEVEAEIQVMRAARYRV